MSTMKYHITTCDTSAGFINNKIHWNALETRTRLPDPNTLEELKVDKGLTKKNKLLVTFVENILGMFNWLAKNPNPERFVLALLFTIIHYDHKLIGQVRQKTFLLASSSSLM